MPKSEIGPGSQKYCTPSVDLEPMRNGGCGTMLNLLT